MTRTPTRSWALFVAVALGLAGVASAQHAELGPEPPREPRRAWVVLHDGSRAPAALAQELHDAAGVDVHLLRRGVRALGMVGTQADATTLARHPNVLRVRPRPPYPERANLVQGPGEAVRGATAEVSTEGALGYVPGAAEASFLGVVLLGLLGTGLRRARSV